MCARSKQPEDVELLVGKENLVCLAKAQTVHLFRASTSLLFCKMFKNLKTCDVG